MLRRTASVAVGTALALTTSLAGPVAADPGTTIGAAGLGDPVFPNLGNGGYEVDDYLIDLAYDATTRLIGATVDITATASQVLSRFDLDAVGLDVTAVRVDDVLASFAQAGEELQVTPRTALAAGSFTVSVDYTVDPRRIAQPVGGFVPTEDGFATAAQPAGAHAVFPCNDHPSDKARLTVRITAPAGSLGVANGHLVSATARPGGATTYTYTSRDPVATELVQISVGHYTVVDRGARDGVFLRDVVPTLRLPASIAALNLTPAQFAWAEGVLGAFPLEGYGLLIADNDADNAFDFTGLETQTLTLYKPKFLNQTEDKIVGHMMHELTHNWFGNSVTPADWSALWLNEGHAELYGLLYRYSRGFPDNKGYTNLDDRMRWVYSQGAIWRASSGAVARPSAATLFDNQRYTGATLALYALRERVGPDVFARIEQEFLTRYRHGNAGTEDWIAVAVDVSGDPGVRPFLTDWLYGEVTPPMPNHPDWTVDPIPPLPAPAPTPTAQPRPMTPPGPPVLPPARTPELVRVLQSDRLEG